jgi:tRNA pseudouridine55 synthase
MSTENIDGILLVNKPKGPTSQKVVEKIKRSARIRAGHAGTLDPAATGVLVVCVGRGTRLSAYLTGCEKQYRATVKLGEETDTMDSTGEVVSTQPVPQLDLDTVRQKVEALVGQVYQTPPMFSAKRVDGKRLYQLARAGIEVEREPKKVRVMSSELIEFVEDEITFEVRCSSGTYVRVLASDLGKDIGCGAHLSSLIRLAVGPFRIESCHSLDDILESARGRGLHELIMPMCEALPWLPRVDLDDRVLMPLVYGTPVRIRGDAPGGDDKESGLARVCTKDGRMVCIARIEKVGDTFFLRPQRVLLKPAELRS